MLDLFQENNKRRTHGVILIIIIHFCPFFFIRDRITKFILINVNFYKNYMQFFKDININ